MASERVCRSRIALSATAEFSRYPPSTEQISWAVTSLNAPLCETKSLSPVSDTLGPVDIVAVIDKSSSMSGNKLELVKKTLLFIVNQLKECDRLSLVTYDTHVYLEFAITSMDEGNKETLRKLIQGLVGGSSTNLCGGLIKEGNAFLLQTIPKCHAMLQTLAGINYISSPEYLGRGRESSY